MGIAYYVGSEKNVLDRFYKANRKYSGDIIVRVTSDCPLMDPILIDDFIKIFLKRKRVDYLSNIFKRSYPDGLDLEIFNKKSLELAWKNTDSSFDKEHVTPYLRRNKFIKKYNVKYHKNFSNNFWGVDYKEDLMLLRSITKYFEPNIYFSWKDILKMKSKNRKIFDINKKKKRTVGIDNNPGQLLWNNAKTIIPGGNMFLSKRPEMYLPGGKWPTYYSKSKGIEIYDLKKKKIFRFYNAWSWIMCICLF